MKNSNTISCFFRSKKKLNPFFFAINLSLFLSSCTFLTSISEEKPITNTELKLEQVVGIGMIEPQDHILTLHSKISGMVKKIYHDVNAHVKKDQIILHLEDKTQQAAVNNAEQRLKTQTLNIKMAKEQIDLMELREQNQKKNYDRDQTLIVQNIISQQAFDNSETAYLEARENLQIAKQNLKIQEQRLQELKQELKYQEELLEQTRIRAPLSGKIAALDVRLGENTSPNQALGSLVPEGPWMAITEIDEQFADRIEEGMQAYIRPQGLDTKLSEGTVILVAPALRKKSLFLDSSSTMDDRRVREVHILLNDTSNILIGQKVESVILLNEAKNVKND